MKTIGIDASNVSSLTSADVNIDFTANTKKAHISEVASNVKHIDAPTAGSSTMTTVEGEPSANTTPQSMVQPTTTTLLPAQPTTSDTVVFNETIDDEPNASCWNFASDRNEISSDEDYFLDEPKDFFDEPPIKKRSKKKTVCRLCGKSVTSLKEHMMMVHKNVRPYKCKICEKTFAKKYYVMRHQQAHRRREIICELCNKKFYWIETFHSHMFMCHPTDAPYTLQCRYCPSTFQHTQDLRVHEQIHEAYDCEHCDRSFDRIDKLAAHHNETHPELEFDEPSEPYEFIPMDTVVDDDETVQDNVAEYSSAGNSIGQGSTLVTGDDDESNVTLSQIQRPSETVKVTDTQSPTKRQPQKRSNKTNKKQMTTPNTELLFRCKKCNFYFITESELIQHRGKVHKKKFRCKTCGIETEDILRHIAKHRYCTFCKTNFDTAIEFTIHNSEVHSK